MNNKLLIFLLGVMLSGGVKAQQHPSYTQYTLNRFALNPAVAGIIPCSELTMGNRRQWTGFEGAPTLYVSSFHTRVNKDDKYPKNFHGVGISAFDSREGFSATTGVKLAYAYHIKLARNYRASVGVFAGIQNKSFLFNQINIANKGMDPALNREEGSTIVYPEISPGGFIYNQNFYAGLSMIQLYPARIDRIGTRRNRLTGHYFLTSGYRFRGRILHYIPSFLFNFSPFISPTMDLTLTVEYDKTISLALGSKYLNSGYATLQLRLFSSVTLGYSYEYALNEISNVAPTTHEIVLTIGSCNSEGRETKFICPAYE